MANFADGGACTWFPEIWKGIKITECCEKHDKNCSTHKFFKCLSKKFKDNKVKLYWLHASYITAGGALGCWVKYTSKMIKRIK